MYSHEPNGYECPFCILGNGVETELNKREDIIFDNGRVVAFVSPKWWVNNPGNVLVIPRAHIENIYDIPDDILGEVYVVAKKVAIAMRKSYDCDGISFRQHNEPAGDQDVWHFHVHVFPRWADDGLYVNHEIWSYITAEERRAYVNKLKDQITV